MGNVTQKDNGVRYSMVGVQDLGKEPFVMVKKEKLTNSQEHEKKDDSKIYISTHSVHQRKHELPHMDNLLKVQRVVIGEMVENSPYGTTINEMQENVKILIVTTGLTNIQKIRMNEFKKTL